MPFGGSWPYGSAHVLVTASVRKSQYVEGTPGADGLLQAIRPKQQEFKEAVRNTAPDFRPFEKTDDDLVAESLTVPEFLSNEEKPCLPKDDDGAIYVDEVMDLALQ